MFPVLPTSLPTAQAFFSVGKATLLIVQLAEFHVITLHFNLTAVCLSAQARFMSMVLLSSSQNSPGREGQGLLLHVGTLTPRMLGGLRYLLWPCQVQRPFRDLCRSRIICGLILPGGCPILGLCVEGTSLFYRGQRDRKDKVRPEYSPSLVTTSGSRALSHAWPSPCECSALPCWG